ncbi:tetratricopeptide repeat protein [Aquimarina sp. RZ0]|uniref:tetratricopeptide repeat-containing sensor histidine kinase n=1 Tax=Aquimarina sp. RZ0 TaxID=2607730 RepID=UPI0011F28AE1|nr:tetratricopeptide repeat protein [Aquimarina sp. RZ0]KAA1247719.1 tetratricopeptide repeat protein [Aquimarina sp. RZ0]
MKRVVLFLEKYVSLFLLFFCISSTAQIDSLEQKLLKASKEDKVEIYIQLVTKYGEIKIDKAVNYAKQGLELLKDKNSKDAGYFYMRLGNFYNKKSQHAQALLYHKKALEVSIELKYELGIGKCYQNIGVTHIKMGQFDQTLDYYLKALKIYKKYNEQSLIVGITGNIGSLYSCRLKDDENGLVYYNRALELSEKAGNDKFRAHVLGAVAEMYMRQKDFLKAKKNLKESISTAEKANYFEINISGWSNLSIISLEENKLYEALNYAKKALKLRLKLGHSEDSTLSYLTLAEIYEKLGDNDAVTSNYNEALSVAIKSQALPQLSKVYHALHEYSNRKKEHKESYKYLLEYNEVKDSLFNIEKDKKLKEIQAQFDWESKEKEVQLLTNENKIKKIENKNQRTTQIILIIGLVALTLVLLTLFYAYKNKKLANTILAEKNKEISQALEDREILLKEVHHRVKNNLQIVSSLLRLQHSFSNHKSSTVILKEIQDKIQAMAIIHERLYKSSNLSLINLRTYLGNLLTYFNTSYNLTEQNITINTVMDDIDLDMDYLVPCGLIVNEILANSIKYAFLDGSNGQINIKASRNQDECILTIEDTGVGFPENFRIEDCQTLGMQLIQGLVKQIKGTVEIISNPGACYIITFKKNI